MLRRPEAKRSSSNEVATPKTGPSISASWERIHKRSVRSTLTTCKALGSH